MVGIVTDRSKPLWLADQCEITVRITRGKVIEYVVVGHRCEPGYPESEFQIGQIFPANRGKMAITDAARQFQEEEGKGFSYAEAYLG